MITGRSFTLRIEHADLRLEADGGSRHQGCSGCDRCPIHGEARCEIVAAVEDDVRLSRIVQQLIFRQRAFNQGQVDVGIERAQVVRAGLHLGPPDIGGFIEYLALQVGQVHVVEIGQYDMPDTAGSQVNRAGGAQPACADQEDR